MVGRVKHFHQPRTCPDRAIHHRPSLACRRPALHRRRGGCCSPPERQQACTVAISLLVTYASSSLYPCPPTIISAPCPASPRLSACSSRPHCRYRRSPSLRLTRPSLRARAAPAAAIFYEEQFARSHCKAHTSIAACPVRHGPGLLSGRVARIKSPFRTSSPARRWIQGEAFFGNRTSCKHDNDCSVRRRAAGAPLAKWRDQESFSVQNTSSADWHEREGALFGLALRSPPIGFIHLHAECKPSPAQIRQHQHTRNSGELS